MSLDWNGQSVSWQAYMPLQFSDLEAENKELMSQNYSSLAELQDLKMKVAKC